ncbi:hypothetical protein NSK_001059 [Nannochloropsis salina CCMP1776]|uniref:ArsA/GET3 Anion-transporting ATPase-like domain-containing protein n=1 Tax=Nannochloropsis salina CCMP1776 TaxID=1027361 RepID=A0A4D9DG36_9STRA|nr:hypothetical protein NSK_001059 [Nannochloropsis salina CCMP1776]|eukprot:TFJ87709.1 hypothetical protein NSK_001059 [Nannochloropsis salina CCMP1776]
MGVGYHAANPAAQARIWSKKLWLLPLLAVIVPNHVKGFVRPAARLTRGVNVQFEQYLQFSGPLRMRQERASRMAVASTATQSSSPSLTGLPNLAELAETRKTGLTQRFIFFGGKGGVGKTSTSTAIAVHLADKGLKTLIISTDPAHSLGDLLEQKVSGGDPVRVEGCDNLWAMEVDTTRALDRFRALFKELDVSALAAQFGVSEEILAGLADVVRLSKGKGSTSKEGAAVNGLTFDRVVIDTAPTGHTLRLLSFPDFLDGFLGKLVKLQLRLSKVLSSLSSLFGGGSVESQERLRATDELLAKVERAKLQMVELRELFRDQDATEFCIVTIATQLAVAESKRLLAALRKEKIAVRHLVVNKLVQDEDQSQHMARIGRGQALCLQRVERGLVADHGLSTVQVPYLDVEVKGVFGLKFMADAAFETSPGSVFGDLFESGGPIATRFVLFGGKGGVGKTSSSAALAVKLADSGFTTAIVSTDPAHSLGDALEMDLSSGRVTEVAGLYGPGRLFALEVDTEEAVEEFKQVLQGLGKGTKGAMKGNGIMDQLQVGEFADVFESAPPGTDELVALARVLKLLKEGTPGEGKRFDRIIIDTAPTGHTLRLLSFPEFLEGFLERVISIRERLRGASSLMDMFGGLAGGGKDKGFSEGDEGVGGGGLEAEDEGLPRDRLREFQLKMIELDDLLHDPARAEFVAVTIPTEMALAETERLVEALKEQDVAIRRVVINQVLGEEVSQGYWARLRAGQQVALADVERAVAAGGVQVTEVPYFDTEMKTVYALRVLADVLTRPGAGKGP